MSATVVISTYSTQNINLVLDCVNSLNHQTKKPHEIILALDSDKELIKFYEEKMPQNVKIVDSGGRGLSTARNAGIKEARSEIIAFIDDDAIADKKWLEHHIMHYNDQEIIGVGGTIKAIWPTVRPIWFPEELDWIVGCSYKGLPIKETSIRNPIGCNMSFRKEAIEKVGYFKEGIGRYGKKLLGSEETELSIRIINKLRNSKIIFDPKSIVYHKISNNRVNLKYFMRRSFYEGISKGIMTKKTINKSNSLTTENHYLKYLIFKSIPNRLSQIYRYKNISEFFSLILSISLVSIGFIFGKLNKNHNI